MDPPVPLSLVLSCAGVVITALLGVVARLLAKRIEELEGATKSHGGKLHELELRMANDRGGVEKMTAVILERLDAQDVAGAAVAADMREVRRKVSTSTLPATRLPIARQDPPSDPPEPPRPRPRLGSRPDR